MAEYDLVIRGGIVVTAADTAACDVGVAGGRIVALAEKLGRGARELDAGNLLVLPGGIDSHCHLNQPSSVKGARTADGFESNSRSAMCGVTTTVIPFALRFRDQSLRQAVVCFRNLDPFLM